MLKDEEMTKEQLAEELKELRRQVAELKTTDNNNSQTEEASYSHEQYKAFMKEAPYSFVLFDSELNYLEINRQALQYLPSGMGMMDIIGRNLADVVPNAKESGRYDKYKEVIRTGKQFLFTDVVTYPELGELTFIIKAFKVANGMGHIAVDITERKRAEEQLEKSLKEKEALLREVHHRVKNNMQVITALLRFQADKIKEKKYADMFKESQDRIKSMALIHERLYQSKDFANIDFTEYVKSLVNELFISHGVDRNKIKPKIEIEDVSLDMENAIPCGLIINEAVSNSLKYAFPEEKEGEIKISLRSFNDDQIELLIGDDGVGISKEVDIRNTETLGLHLIARLVEYQLSGEIELNRINGTEYHIKFKRQLYKKRI